MADDLMEAAIRAVDNAREDFLLAKASENKALIRQVAISVVHGALLAEREACAKIADDEADKLKLRDGPDKRRDPLNKQIVAMKVVCRDIAASIRRAP